MKLLTFILFFSLGSTAVFADFRPIFTIRKPIVVKPAFKNLRMNPYPTKGREVDHLTHIVESTKLMGHELTHVIQQKSGEVKAIIKASSNGELIKSKNLFKSLILVLGKESISVDINELNRYITQKVMEKMAPNILAQARIYASQKSVVDQYQNDLKFLKGLRSQCLSQRSDCSRKTITDLNKYIGETEKNLVQEMNQMNMQFLSLQNTIQQESRKFQTLSNISKARHDIAMNAIRNIRA